MVRCAFLLSGHTRSFERTYQSLVNNILQPLQPDIFISTRPTAGFDGIRDDGKLMNVPTDIEKLQRYYNPKKIKIIPERRYDTSKYNGFVGSGIRNPEILFWMFENIKTANDLKCEFEKENNMIFDVVIRSRFDLFYQSKFDLNELEMCKNNGVIFPKFGNYSGYCDQLAFGNSKSMNLYSNVYDNLDILFDIHKNFHPESMVKYNLDYYNLPAYRTNMDYVIMRANGSSFRNANN